MEYTLQPRIFEVCGHYKIYEIIKVSRTTDEDEHTKESSDNATCWEKKKAILC